MGALGVVPFTHMYTHHIGAIGELTNVMENGGELVSPGEEALKTVKIMSGNVAVAPSGQHPRQPITPSTEKNRISKGRSMKRVITGGISHETSTFTPVETTLESYKRRFLVRGQAILEAS